MTAPETNSAKYVYWLPEKEVDPILESLEERDRDVFEINKAVCIPLSDKHEIGVIRPETWQEYVFCRRQMSWYHESPFAGKTLLVSDSDLGEYDIRPETIIHKLTYFRPPRLPRGEDYAELLQKPGYCRTKPRVWDRIQDEDPQIHERWLKVMRLRGVTFEELFVSHCANHANFIEPSWYITDGAGIVPYSIGPTARVCSACLEFYNIIGREFKKKLVVPCPGAVIFAGMEANAYYEVSRP